MKLKLAILPVLVCCNLLWGQKSDSKYLTFSEGKIFWIVTKNTTNRDLEYIEQTLAKKDIFLRFWGVWRDNKNKIERIDEIACKQDYNFTFNPEIKELLKKWNTSKGYEKRPLIFHFTPNYGCEVDMTMFGLPESLRQVAKAEGYSIEPPYSQMDTLGKNFARFRPVYNRVITLDTDGPKLKEMSALGLKGWLIYVRPDESLDIVEKYRDSTQIFVGEKEVTFEQLRKIKVGEIGKVNSHQRPKTQNNKPVKRRPQDKEYVVWIELIKPTKP